MDVNINKLNIDKSDWTLVKFGDIASEPKENIRDILAEGIEHIVGLEHIDSEDIHLRRSANIETSTTFNKKFKKGDVLFGRRRAYLKKAAQAPFSGICSGDITVFRAKKSILPELLPFIVCNDKFFDYAVKHSAGGLSPRVKFKDLANYEFLLPPKNQQKQLAELLWAMDEVIEKDIKTASLAKQAKNLVLRELFMQIWDNTNKFLFKYSFNDFKSTQFEEICVESMFGPRFSSKLYSDNGNIASLRTTDLDNDGIISYETMPKALILKNKFKEHYLEKGDLVISRSGTCGVTAVFESFHIPVIPAAFLIRFRINDSVNPNYLKLFFNSEIGRQITSKLASGAVQKNLTSKALLKVNIPLPSLKIQNEILELIDGFIPEIFQSKIASSQALQKSLINQIF